MIAPLHMMFDAIILLIPLIDCWLSAIIYRHLAIEIYVHYIAILLQRRILCITSLADIGISIDCHFDDYLRHLRLSC